MWPLCVAVSLNVVCSGVICAVVCVQDLLLFMTEPHSAVWMDRACDHRQLGTLHCSSFWLKRMVLL